MCSIQTAMIQGTMIAMDLLDKHKGGHGGVIVNIASLAGEITECYKLTLTNNADFQLLACLYSITQVSASSCLGASDDRL